MKKRTSVHLAKGISSPVFFHVLGEATGPFIRVAKERDWSVFHFPDVQSPVVKVWDTLGQQLLYGMHLLRDVPTHARAAIMIEEWMESDWRTHPKEWGGVSIPLITNDHFVVVPDQPEEIETQTGDILVVEPPCLLWYERNQGKEGGVITSTILIH